MFVSGVREREREKEVSGIRNTKSARGRNAIHSVREIRVAIVRELCSRNEKRGARDAAHTDQLQRSILFDRSRGLLLITAESREITVCVEFFYSSTRRRIKIVSCQHQFLSFFSR